MTRDVVPEPGGYQRENAATFGAGALRRKEEPPFRYPCTSGGDLHSYVPEHSRCIWCNKQRVQLSRERRKKREQAYRGDGEHRRPQ